MTLQDACKRKRAASDAVQETEQGFRVASFGQFTLRSLLLCAASVPLAIGLTWWLRRHPPKWRRETVLKIVCGLLTVTGVGLIVPAVAALLG